MRKPTALVVIAVLCVLALFVLRVDRPYAAQDDAAPVQKWEYTTAQFRPGDYNRKKLATLGNEGWEFCQAIPRESHPTTVVFKRPLK